MLSKRDRNIGVNRWTYSVAELSVVFLNWLHNERVSTRRELHSHQNSTGFFFWVVKETLKLSAKKNVLLLWNCEKGCDYSETMVKGNLCKVIWLHRLTSLRLKGCNRNNMDTMWVAAFVAVAFVNIISSPSPHYSVICNRLHSRGNMSFAIKHWCQSGPTFN